MSNCLWQMDTEYGVAYLEDRKLVAELLKLEGSRSRPKDAVMATYFSAQGKVFAWQVRFSVSNWERVSRALGLASCEKKPARRTKSRRTPGTRRRRPA